MKIKKTEVLPDGDKYRLKIVLDCDVDDDWIQAYQEALTAEAYTSMRSSGAPTVDKVKFEDNFIVTNSFAEYAKSDAKEFLKELEKVIERSNPIYDRLVHKRIDDEMKEIEKEDLKKKKLKDMNDFFNK